MRGRGRPARRTRPAQSPRRGGGRRAPAPGTARSPTRSPRRFRRAAAGVCLLVPRRLPRRMASCDRGDTQFPELSGGGSGSGSRARSELLATAAAAAAPILKPFLAGAPAPDRRCRPGGTRGGVRRGRFQRRKWLLDARERLICNWGRADWCSWRRRGGRSCGGGGWPLSNGEGGGGGDAAAEGAGLGCATRRCHHCTGANSGGGAGSYFPLLPRCCFCRLGRRRRRRRIGREGGGGAARSRGPAYSPAGGGSRAQCSPLRGGVPVPPQPRGAPLAGILSLLTSPRTPPPSHGSSSSSSPQPRLGASRVSPRPLSPPPPPQAGLAPGFSPQAGGGDRSPGAGEC